MKTVPRSWRPSQTLLDRMKALDIRNESQFVLEAVEERVRYLEGTRLQTSPDDLDIRSLALERDIIEKEIRRLEYDPVYLKNRQCLLAISQPKFGSLYPNY